MTSLSNTQSASAVPRNRHLAIFLPSLAGGGAEKMLLGLAGRAVQRGYRVDMVIVREEGELLTQVPSGVRVIPLRRRTPRSAIRPLARYLRKERPGALLSSLYRANIAAVIAGKMLVRGVRVVVREANLEEYYIGRRSWQSFVDNLLGRIAYRACDCVIAVSGYLRDSLIERKWALPKKIRVIRNPAPHQAGGGERVLPATPVVLACGRLAPEKDYATLLRAFAELRRRIAARLVLLGDGPLRAALERQAAELGIQDDVAFAGYVANPTPYFLAASVFAHTAMMEAMPNVLLQALSAGCPIVATDCPGGVNEVLASGKFGTLVKVGDAIGIADALERVIRGAVTFPDVTEHLQQFNVDTITDAYLGALFPSTAST